MEGLKTGTVYTVQVRARTVAGYGSYSHPVDYSTSLHGTFSFPPHTNKRQASVLDTLDNQPASALHDTFISIFL